MTVLSIQYISGKYQVVSTSNGIADRRNVGPRWATPREAADYVKRMETLEPVSPLRSRSEADSTEAILGLATGDARPLNEADRHPLRSPHPESGASTPGFTPTPASLWDLVPE